MRLTSIALATLLAAGAAWAQQVGPIEVPPPPTVKRIPLYAKVPPPSLPPDEIIRQFTANEVKNREAYGKYGFVETILVEELGGQDNGVTGSYQIKVEVFVGADGKRYERILSESRSSLQFLQLSAQDLETIATMQLFPLAGKAADDYNFTYRGTEKVDELTTYAFQVEPKAVEPGHIYFSGVVWVDNVDLAIVKSYGHFVMNEPKPANTLPFSFYDTYRENLTGKLWFPTYIRSDDDYTRRNSQLPIQLIVRSTDFYLGKPQIPPSQSR